MWKLTSDAAKNWEPLPGIPWRDMDDKEFREVAKSYAADNGFAARALHGSGFFEHVQDEADGRAPADEDEEKTTDAAPADAPATEGDK